MIYFVKSLSSQLHCLSACKLSLKSDYMYLSLRCTYINYYDFHIGGHQLCWAGQKSWLKHALYHSDYFLTHITMQLSWSKDDS